MRVSFSNPGSYNQRIYVGDTIFNCNHILMLFTKRKTLVDISEIMLLSNEMFSDTFDKHQRGKCVLGEEKYPAEAKVFLNSNDPFKIPD